MVDYLQKKLQTETYIKIAGKIITWDQYAFRSWFEVIPGNKFNFEMLNPIAGSVFR